MDNILFVLCFIILLTSLVLVLRVRKLSNQKDIKIKEMTKKLGNLDKKLKDKERRKSFRLKVDIEECEFQILKIGNKNIDRVKDRKGIGIIKDLSFTGLRLESAYDLPVKDVVEIKLEFEFDEHELELKGVLIRKEEHIYKGKFIYGIKFIETNKKTQTEFNKLLRNKELENRRKKLHDWRVI